MNSCGNCNACCSGILYGEIYGHIMDGNPCHFLKEGKCSIYDKRPQDPCRNYQCFYIQDILPGFKRPDENGILVTVKNNGITWLVYNIIDEQNYDEKQLLMLKDFGKTTNTLVTNLWSIEQAEPLLDFFLSSYDNQRVESKELLKNSIKLLEPFCSNIKDVLFLLSKLDKMKLYEEVYQLSKKIMYSEEIVVYFNDEDLMQTYVNFFNTCLNTNRPKEAELINNKLEDLIKKHQDNEEMFVKMLSNKSIICNLYGDKEGADKINNYLLQTFNLSTRMKNRLLYNNFASEIWKGNFKKGMKVFIEVGPDVNSWGDDVLFYDKKNQKIDTEIKKWDGSKITKGSTIVIKTIAGFGDTFVNVRFYNNLKELGYNPVYLIEQRENSLKNLFEYNNIQTISSIDLLDEEDLYYVKNLELPVVLDLDEKDLWNGSYLKANPIYVNKWKEKLTTNKKLKIGIRWKGNTDYEHDLHRSLPLKMIYDSVKHLDAEFYCLQLDNLEELNDFPGLIDLSNDIKDWDDTFGILENLDFIITSCTSLAHASGSLGKKTFIFTPMLSYYIWSFGPDLDSTPWYGDNLKVLYQKTPENWNEPFKELRDTLLLEYK